MSRGDDGALREKEKHGEMNTQWHISVIALWKVFTGKTQEDVQPCSRWKATVDSQEILVFVAINVEKPWWLRTLELALMRRLLHKVMIRPLCLSCWKETSEEYYVWLECLEQFPLCPEIIVTDYIKRSVFDKLALFCYCEIISMKCSLLGSDKKEE